MSETRTLLVGLGSPHGDDRIGWIAVEQLRAVSLEGVILRPARSPVDLLDWLEGIERLVVCDACRGSGPPGQTRHWLWPSIELTRLHGAGSHDFSLSQVLELAEGLDRLPPLVEIWTVEIGGDGPGETLSAEVEAALPALIQDIEDSLREPRRLGGRVIAGLLLNPGSV